MEIHHYTKEKAGMLRNSPLFKQTGAVSEPQDSVLVDLSQPITMTVVVVSLDCTFSKWILAITKEEFLDVSIEFEVAFVGRAHEVG